MTRHRYHYVSVATLCLCIGACVPDGSESSVLLLSNVAPTEMACASAPSESASGLTGGRIWSGSPIGYVLTPLMKNFASSANGTVTAQRTFFVQGFRISVSSADSATQAAIGGNGTYTVQAAFSIPPDGSLATTPFVALPPSLVAAIGNTLSDTKSTTSISLSVEAVGQMGGSSVTTNAFSYPIDICTNCVVRVPAQCNQLPSSFTPSKGNSCNGFQDGVIDCCEASPGVLTCPAVGTMP